MDKYRDHCKIVLTSGMIPQASRHCAMNQPQSSAMLHGYGRNERKE